MAGAERPSVGRRPKGAAARKPSADRWPGGGMPRYRAPHADGVVGWWLSRRHPQEKQEPPAAADLGVEVGGGRLGWVGGMPGVRV